MKLIYTPKEGFRSPRPEWPARDHDESNAKVAEEKIGSKFYRKARKSEEPGEPEQADKEASP